MSTNTRNRLAKTNREISENPLNRTASGSKNDNLPHAHQEIYRLKDQIVACLGEIHSYQHHGFFDSDQCKKMAALTLSYKNSKDSLEQMLLNQGPNWTYAIVDSITAFGFRQPNPDTISSLILQLKEVTEILFRERTKVQNRYRTCGYLNYENLMIDAKSRE